MKTFFNFLLNLYSTIISSFSFSYASVFILLEYSSGIFISISFTIFAILSCGASIDAAAIIASLFPFAPACANPLNIPTTTTFSPATTSAPALTSPKITKLPSNSTLCPDLREPL